MTPVPEPNAELAMEDVVAGYYSYDLVLDHVTMKAFSNRVTVVLGPNGSGKSTSLRILYGILSPRTGRVLLGKTDITRVDPYNRLALGIAFLPQGRSVFPELTVHENLQVGAWTLRKDHQRFTAAIQAAYDRYPLLKDWRNKYAGSLSGGQQRLLEIARMMVSDPHVILIDEPSAGLAPILVDQVYEEIGRLKDEKRTIFLVDQNVREAVALADHIYTLEQGRNCVEGDRAEFEDKLGPLIKGWLKF